MTASTVLHHAALAASVAALAAAGLRAAALVAPRGLARLITATVLAAATAVATALVLGLVALGTSTVALTAAALLTWAAVRRLVPEPAVSVREDVGRWWSAQGRVERVLLGAAAGAWAAWTVWLLRYPALGHDMVLYHLPEAAGWVHNGRPGSVVPVISVVPVGNYPLTFEVLLAWGMGLARSFVPATLVVAAMPPLIAAAGWLGLRTLGVGLLAAGTAVAALVATPAVLASQSGGASLDPAALAWLLCCAALCAGARERPVQLVPAVVAAGLAIGTKTTAAPLTLVVLAVAAVSVRGRLRALVTPLAAATGGALVVGGYWYLRNLVDHGSPLWPFVDAPWGDPRPPLIDAADISFLDRPGDTLDRLAGYYTSHFGGPLILLAGAIVVAIAARSRAVAAAGLAAAVSVLIWMNAPFTGVVDHPGFDVGTGDATRYLLPGVAAAAAALALATRREGIVRWLALGALGAALLAGLENSFDLGFPNVPSPTTLITGAVLGAAAVAAGGLVGPALTRAAPAGLPAAVLTALAVAVAAPLGALAADGYVGRHADTGTRESPLAAWFASQEEWRERDGTVASTWSLIGTLSGDRLQHRLELIGASEACRRLVASDRDEWLVVDLAEARARGQEDCAPGEKPAYVDPDYSAYQPVGDGATSAAR